MEIIMKTVVIQLWQRKNRGSPEDESGCSLHICAADRHDFVREYWGIQPEKIPDHYEAPWGGYFEITVNEKIFKKIKNSKNGIRLYSVPSGVPKNFTNTLNWKDKHAPLPFPT